MRSNSLFVGFMFGVIACMIWGGVYIIPLLLPEYDPLMLAAGRYVFFGLVCLGFVSLQKREFAQYCARDWTIAALLGVIGNIVYYWFLIQTINLAGAPFAGMCMSVIPVLVALIANRQERDLSKRLPFAKLVPGLVAIVFGIVLANIGEFEAVAAAGQSNGFWLGVICGIVALGIWTWYPMANAKWLQANPERNSAAWSTAQGVTALPCALLMYAVLCWQDPTPGLSLGPRPVFFIFMMAVAGLVCSWLGIVFWNAMSKRMPRAIGGQMIVFETVFAVVYAHVWRGAWPDCAMLFGTALLICGVLLALRAFSAHAAKV